MSMLPLFLACSLLALSTVADAAARRVAETPVILVGETHGSSTSLAFAGGLVETALLEENCVTVAVEIPHTQQPILDAVAEGDAALDEVDIYPVIGHPAYRRWLGGLLARVRTSRCLRVLAADLAWEEPGDRDAAIAERIAREVADGRFVIGVFGQLHVSRGAAYRYSLRRSAADRLLAQGIDVLSVIDAPSAGCGPSGLDAADSPRAAAAIADLRHVINGGFPANAADIVDGVLVSPDCPEAALEAVALD